ncbi:MAG: hypothetical protein HY820_42425 [Acidobacteria bacterium]|nr:hypothetical protein [Acidobacteriota bacterium]
MPEKWFVDTDPKALAVYIELHRRLTPQQRLARMFELCDMQQAMQEANVRANYPDASDREVFLRVATRRLGRELMMKVYDWDPDLHP